MREKILEKLQLDPSNPESYPILISCLYNLTRFCEDGNVALLSDWPAPFLPKLKNLDVSELTSLRSGMSNALLSLEDCQSLVQTLIPYSERKRLAVYYTIDNAATLMGFILQEYLTQKQRDHVVIADPFLGSGKTLTRAIQIVGSEHIDGIWGVEPLPFPALVAYTSLVVAMKGKTQNIKVSVGDAFQHIIQDNTFMGGVKAPFADVILTNPPFTRWSNLKKQYRKNLLQAMSDIGYQQYLTRGGASLQAISLMLADYLLKDNGLLATVLPASTFYTIYGQGVKQLLRDRYEILAMIEGNEETAFSEDSGFKEVILIAIKRPTQENLGLFTQLRQPIKQLAKAIFTGQKTFPNLLRFNIHNMVKFLDLNWLALFEDPHLREAINQLLKEGYSRGTLGDGQEVLGKKNIVRGLEMYGPNFFFLPNQFWSIIDENHEAITIQDKKHNELLNIEKHYLLRVLRRWRFYRNTIKVTVDHWMLNIPPHEIHTLPMDLQKYIKVGQTTGTAKSALDAFGKSWYSHVHAQIRSKNPFGRVFIPDKIDLRFKSRGVIANYADPIVTASKNFYIVKNLDENLSKVLVGWLNSIFFVAIMVLSGRKISKYWTRFLEHDYLERPVLNLKSIDSDMIVKICSNIDTLLGQDLPPFWNQLADNYRMKLDQLIAEAIGVEDPNKTVSQLYDILGTKFTGPS